MIIIGNSKTNTNNINNTRNINNNGQYFIRCELLQAYCERASVRAHIPLSIFGLIERCDHSPKNYVVAGDSQVTLNMATYYTHIYILLLGILLCIVGSMNGMRSFMNA